MKKLMTAAVALVGLMATVAHAEYTLNVGGVDYPLADLMENCGTASGGSEAQLKCFNTLSQMVRQQSGNSIQNSQAIAEALDALRSLAQYQDDDSRLSIGGSDCKVKIVYYNNYFHISRRNVSSIDLFSVEFDASRMQFNQTAQIQGASMTWSRGLMDIGVMATAQGGAELGADGVLPQKPARASIEEYANTVMAQLPVREAQTFDFVLVHPKRLDATVEIWKAFETYVNTCRARGSS